MIVSKLFPEVIILFSIFVKINKNKLVDAPVCKQHSEGQILGISYKKPATILCEVSNNVGDCIAGLIPFITEILDETNHSHTDDKANQANTDTDQ